MNIKKLIDDQRKSGKCTVAQIYTSIREELLNTEKTFSLEHNLAIVSLINDFLGAKSTNEKNEILLDIIEIFSEYDDVPHSAHVIGKKLFKAVGIKYPF